MSSTDFERRGGGKGANQAVAVAKAGGTVKLVGAVGDDGQWLLNDLKSMGVSVDGVSVQPVSEHLRTDSVPFQCLRFAVGAHRTSDHSVDSCR